MSSEVDGDGIDEASGSVEMPIFGENDRVDIVRFLLGSGWREPSSALSFGKVGWRPALVGSNKTICHLSLVQEVRDPWQIRIRAARAAGYDVFVAAPEACWTDRSVEAVFELDARPIVLVQGGKNWRARQFDSIPRFIAKESRVLSSDMLSRLGAIAMDRALRALTNADKGRTFEDVLILAFSQVTFFKVESFNFKNATEEIDLVLRDRRIQSQPTGSLVLVSAKNNSKPLSTDPLDELETKMRNRGPRCSLGFLCVSRRFASTVAKHALRMARDERVIVLLTGDAIRAVMNNVDGIDKAIEAEILAAELR